MTKQEISKLMAVIALEFSGRFEVSDERVSLWQETLGNISYKLAMKAIVRAIRESGQFPPNVGTIYEICCEIIAEHNRKIRLAQKEQQFALPEPIDPVKLEEGRKMLRDLVVNLSSKVKGVV